MKKLLSLFLAALLAIGCLSATAATFDGTGDLAAVIAAAQPKSEFAPDADDAVELTKNCYLYYDAQLKAGTFLKGKDAVRELTVDGAVLAVEPGAKIEDISLRLTNGAVLRLYGGADLTALKGLTKDSSSRVEFVYVNGTGYSPASSFISAPVVKDAVVANVPNGAGNPTGEFAASIKKGEKAQVTLKVNQHLPLGAKLLLGDAEGTEKNESGVRSFVFEVTPSSKTTYAIRVKVGSVVTDTANTLTLYGFSAGDAKAERSSVSPSFVIGEGRQLFDVTLPEGFSVTASVENKYADALAIDAAGKVTALKPLDNAEVDFTFVFTYPNGTKGQPIERTVKGLKVASPVSAKESAAVYVDRLSDIFDITVPAGYTVTEVKCDNGDVLVSAAAPESITVRKTMNNKAVKFTFTFKNAADQTFTVEKTVRITAKVYQYTYVVTVIAPKNYLSTGEIVQLSVPREEISTATSSNPAVAAVDGNGRVTGRAPGTAIIHVYTPGGGHGTIQMTVSGASTYVYAPKNSITVDETMQLSVPGDQIVAASSSNSRIVTVTDQGKVQGVNPGTATVYVSTLYGRGASIQITVTQKALKITAPSSMTVGQQANIKVSNDSILRAVSSNTSVLSIYGNSTLYARRAGTAVVTVTTTTGRTGSVTVTVSDVYIPDEPIASSTKTLKVGASTQLKVSGDSIIAAYSSDDSVATVTAQGKVTGRKAGTAVIYIYTAAGRNGSITVKVTGSASSGSTATSTKTLKVDQSTTLKVSGKKIVAASLEEDNGTVTVTKSGKVTAVNEGTDTVLLITSDNKVVRVKVTVKSRGGEIDCKKNVKVALREKASSKSDRLAKLSRGTELEILGRSGSYYYVEAFVGDESIFGYVSRSYVDKW